MMYIFHVIVLSRKKHGYIKVYIYIKDYVKKNSLSHVANKKIMRFV